MKNFKLIVVALILVSCSTSQSRKGKPVLSLEQTPVVKLSSIDLGKEVYRKNCKSCHQSNGRGVSGMYPPVRGIDALKNTEYLIDVILNGVSGELKVSGKTYSGSMVGYNCLSDKEVADLVNYLQKDVEGLAKVNTGDVSQLR